MDRIFKPIEESLNVIIPEKCFCCPYMFEHKCRSNKCPFDDDKNTTDFND